VAFNFLRFISHHVLNKVECTNPVLQSVRCTRGQWSGVCSVYTIAVEGGVQPKCVV